MNIEKLIEDIHTNSLHDSLSDNSFDGDIDQEIEDIKARNRAKVLTTSAFKANRHLITLFCVNFDYFLIHIF